MWLQLTDTDGRRVTVNTANIAYVRDASDGGSVIAFSAGDGQVHVAVTVLQSHEQIVASMSQTESIRSIL